MLLGSRKTPLHQGARPELDNDAQGTVPPPLKAQGTGPPPLKAVPGKPLFYHFKRVGESGHLACSI